MRKLSNFGKNRTMILNEFKLENFKERYVLSTQSDPGNNLYASSDYYYFYKDRDLYGTRIGPNKKSLKFRTRYLKLRDFIDNYDEFDDLICDQLYYDIDQTSRLLFMLHGGKL